MRTAYIILSFQFTQFVFLVQFQNITFFPTRFECDLHIFPTRFECSFQGEIDQVLKTVSISYVYPRVLDRVKNTLETSG